MDLQEKIRNRTAKVAVIGLGYVGLPLAVLFARKGFPVLGVDREPHKIDALRSGRSYIRDVGEDDLAVLAGQGHGWANDSLDALPGPGLDVIIVCVPTPLNASREPDLSALHEALDMIARHLRPGQLVVLESTSYPGTTEEVAVVELAKSGYRAGEDFCLAYSPERIDPGNKQFSVEHIPKVVAGCTPRCTETAFLLYSQVVSQVIKVSSPKVAEMAKLLENTYRSVNIALVEELAVAAHDLGIDIWEVIRAASTKPFGFMPFYPGPGVGGHCLPVDPVYLAWQVRRHRCLLRLVETANQIHSEMPSYVVKRLDTLLVQRGVKLHGAKIMVLGVTYKKDVEDLRESPALEIISLLVQGGAQVSYHDPFIPWLHIGAWQKNRSQLTEELIASQDCTVILTDHSTYDFSWLVRHCNLLFDTRNATAQSGETGVHVIRL